MPTPEQHRRETTQLYVVALQLLGLAGRSLFSDWHITNALGGSTEAANATRNVERILAQLRGSGSPWTKKDEKLWTVKEPIVRSDSPIAKVRRAIASSVRALKKRVLLRPRLLVLSTNISLPSAAKSTLAGTLRAIINTMKSSGS
jgi:hypothetical protein